jgi:hypothetical protein
MSSPTVPAPQTISELDFLLCVIDSLNHRAHEDLASLVAATRRLQRHIVTLRAEAIALQPVRAMDKPRHPKIGV